MFISVYGIFWYLFYPMWSKPCNSTFVSLAENQTAQVPMILWVSAHPWNLAKWSFHVLFQRNQTMNLKLEEVNVKKVVQNWLVLSFFSHYCTPWTCLLSFVLGMRFVLHACVSVSLAWAKHIVLYASTRPVHVCCNRPFSLQNVLQRLKALF